MPIDIFDTEKAAPDRVFRYPVYERYLWLTVVVVAVAALVFLRHVQDFLAMEGTRGWAVVGVVVLFLLITIWVSLRAAISKVVISPVSLKARVFGQGVQRISWVHIQAVVYRWRPLGHKLVFIGSDGAKVSFRSAIRGYDQLIGFIRESAPGPVRDQLEDIFGEEAFPDEEGPEAPEAPEAAPPALEPPEDEHEEEEEEEPSEEAPRPPEPQPEPTPPPPASEPPPPPEPEPTPPPAPPAPEPPPPTEPEPTPPAAPAEAEAKAPVEQQGEQQEEAAEEPQAKEKPRKWWWVFLGR